MPEFPAPAHQGTRSAARRVHLVHIVADDLGYNDLGYVNPDLVTPRLDTLARSGVRLDTFYTFKTCAPTRASMLTGRYPFRVGVYSNQDVDSYGVPSNFTMAPALLRELGDYATHAIGKWHLGFRSPELTPTWRGFDSFFGYWHCCASGYEHRRFAHGKDLYLDLTNATGKRLRPALGHDGRYSAFLYADEASRIIRHHDVRRPLYLYLSFQSVHGPDEVPARFEQLYAARHPEWSAARHVSAGMVTALDEAVGQVVDTLMDTGLWDNTLCIFNSDNGAPWGWHLESHSNAPLRGAKFGLWEGGVRVRAFLTGGSVHAQRGTTWAGLAHASDLLPTMMAAAGLPMPVDTGPTPLDGFSLWEAVRSNSTSPRTSVVHQVLNQFNLRDCLGADHDKQNCGAAIRIGKFKLLAGYPGWSQWAGDAPANPAWRGDPDWQRYGGDAHKQPRGDGCRILSGDDCPCWRSACLFDLEADPGERTDLSRTLPAVTRRLLHALRGESSGGTQGSHLPKGRAAADTLALERMLHVKHAFLPFANFSGWHNDASAPSCYNPLMPWLERKLQRATGLDPTRWNGRYFKWEAFWNSWEAQWTERARARKFEKRPLTAVSA